jgi:hypothetical protein
VFHCSLNLFYKYKQIESRKQPAASPVYTRFAIYRHISFVLSGKRLIHYLNFNKMKKTTIIFWVATSIIFLMEGLIPALTSQTQLAKEGISHLGYPLYFGNMLVVFKVAGALALLFPQVNGRIKEWAYAGFTFEFIAAAVSHGAIDGVGNFQTFLPLLFLLVLAVSYITYHKKLNAGNTATRDKDNNSFDKKLASA